MNNKTQPYPLFSKDSQFYVPHAAQLTVKYIEPSERIFPPPSFLFDSKEDHKFSDKSIKFSTLNSFKPKLLIRPSRQPLFSPKKSNSRPSKKESLHPGSSIRDKIQRLIDGELASMNDDLPRRSQPLKPSLESRRTLKESDFRKKYYESQQILPHNKFSTTSFNSKTSMSKSKMFNNKNQPLFQLGPKKSLSQQLQELDDKIPDAQDKSILELMTIFSIKDQQKSKNGQAKHNVSRRKELYKSLGEKKYKIRYRTKLYICPEEEPDISLDKIYFKKINSFLTFALKVNYSNNLPITKVILSQKNNYEKVKVYVGKGNNKYLLISLLKRRFWLEVTNKITTDTKFVWTQNSIKQLHQSQKPSKKVSLQSIMPNIKQLDSFNPEKRRDKAEISEQMPQALTKQKACLINTSVLHTYKSLAYESSPKLPFRMQKMDVFKRQQNKKLFLNPEKAIKAQFLLKNFKIYTKSKGIDYNPQNLPILTNHVPQNSYIGSKKALFYTMQHYYRKIKQIDPFTIIPKTYHFKNSDQDSYNAFIIQQKQENDKKIWIVKPGECTNRGNGISLIRTADVSKKLLKKQLHSNGQAKTTILQSYITDPLLYNGRKFDIRHFMLITVVNGNLKAYWYNEGYLRTSSQYFSLQNLSNMYIHLTNDAIQKTSEKYGKYQAGNKLSYTQFQRYLDSNYSRKQINFKEHILAKMKSIATDVITANYLNIDKDRKMNNFQIFGLDFMIDSKFKPWLIEINANPCLEISCPLLSRIIPTMVEHSLRLGLDPLLLPPSHYPPKSRYYLSDNFIQNLRYEIIFDQLEETVSPEGLKLSYDFDFDQPEDEYQNEGTQVDLGKVLD